MSVKTHEGGKAFARSPQQELFLRATTMFAGQDHFYESANEADTRAVELIRDLAVTDYSWVCGFLPWLRQKGNIRTMSTVLAVEAVRARLNTKVDVLIMDAANHTLHGVPVLTNRQLINSVLQRPDEPGKMLKYHFEHYGKTVPISIKRGIADSLDRMLNQRQALRYDKPGDEIRLGDVVEFTHPHAKNDLQGLLYTHLITNRHDREGYEPDVRLKEIHARWVLQGMDPAQRHEFAAEVQAGDVNAVEMWNNALAGSWEWGKLWLGEKD